MKRHYWLFWAGVLGMVATGRARADLIVLPESRHQQYSTYGLFVENQSAMLQRTGGRAWAAIGNNIALFEFPEMKHSPQLVLAASANASFRVIGVGMLL